MSEQINKAKEALLHALEALDNAEKKIGGEADRVELVVVYTAGREIDGGKWTSFTGYVNTPAPAMYLSKLLDEASIQLDDAPLRGDLSADDDPPA